MAVYVCKCGHHGWEHSGGIGHCRVEVMKAHPTDKKVRPIRRDCPCNQFEKGKTLAEHQANQVA